MFEILQRLKKINTNQELSIILKRLEKDIVLMNTDEQLFDKGITIKGVKIKPKYAESTKRLKRRLGMPFDRVTTRMSGNYHKAFKIDIDKNSFELVVSYDVDGFDLSSHLDSTYGDIRGLTDANVNKLIQMIRPLLIEAINRKI